MSNFTLKTSHLNGVFLGVFFFLGGGEGYGSDLNTTLV